ncbi:MAG: hypothetical protein ABF242_04160 [Flavobacteriales bacterium]
MKKNILLIASVAFAAVLLSTSCKKPLDSCTEFFEQGCDTTTEYEPVCGCNEKTYANKTYAECAGVDYVDGACN